MTKAEYNAIENAIWNCREREQRLAKEYIKLNPDEKYRRQSEMYLVLIGLESALQEIRKNITVK